MEILRGPRRGKKMNELPISNSQITNVQMFNQPSLKLWRAGGSTFKDKDKTIADRTIIPK